MRVIEKGEWRAYSLAAYGGMPHLLVGLGEGWGQELSGVTLTRRPRRPALPAGRLGEGCG